jgi:hypothetical protein
MTRKNKSLPNEDEIKHILEDQELEKENDELLETNEELTEINEELTEENVELETEVKKVKKEVIWLIVFMLFLAIILGSAIGFYYFQNIRTGQSLAETTKKAQSSEEKAQSENKLRMEQELKLAQATKENQGLKDAAAKKAEEDAVKELKSKDEADKASRKYVTANKKESVAPGLNTRTSPCGDLIGTLRVWGTAGEVLEGPNKPGACLGGEYEWYRVRWNDGVEGWSIVNYLDFTGEKQFSKTGYITGYVPVGYDNNTSKQNILPKICATNTVDKIVYCSAEVNTGQQNYKLVVPEGEYVMSGKFKYQDYQTNKLIEQDLIFSVSQQCGYTNECYQKFPQGYKKNAKFKVTVGSIVTGVNLSTFYNEDGTPGVNNIEL